MKKNFIILFTTILSILVICFYACSKDTAITYNSTNLQVKSSKPAYDFEIDDESSHPYATTGWNDFRILYNYDEYLEYGLDLGYTTSFFESYNLIILLKTSCSSDGMLFERIDEKDGALYPVIKRCYISNGQAVTADIIFNIFYAEIPSDANYTLGEVLYEYY